MEGKKIIVDDCKIELLVKQVKKLRDTKNMKREKNKELEEIERIDISNTVSSANIGQVILIQYS